MNKTAHVLGIGHGITQREWSTNPFVHNTLVMCDILKDIGFTVNHYGMETSEANCDEHIDCVMIDEAEKFHGKNFKEQPTDFNTTEQYYTTNLFNARAEFEIKQRVKRGDLLMVMGGKLHQTLCTRLENIGLEVVEPACGYPDIFTRFRVFPSSTWQQRLYTQFAANWDKMCETLDPSQQTADRYLTTASPESYVKPCDAVIPHCLYPDDFEISEKQDNYFLVVARVIPSKGIQMAIDIAAHFNKKLIIAGNGDFHSSMGFAPPPHVECIGPVGRDRRKDLMSRAITLIAWGHFPESFGLAAVESAASGRPPITSNLGAYRETITDGVNGFRVDTLQEACEAVEKLKALEPKKVRKHTLDNFSVKAVTPKFDKYFKRLQAHLERGKGVKK